MKNFKGLAYYEEGGVTTEMFYPSNDATNSMVGTESTESTESIGGNGKKQRKVNKWNKRNICPKGSKCWQRQTS